MSTETIKGLGGSRVSVVLRGGHRLDAASWCRPPRAAAGTSGSSMARPTFRPAQRGRGPLGGRLNPWGGVRLRCQRICQRTPQNEAVRAITAADPLGVKPLVTAHFPGLKDTGRYGPPRTRKPLSLRVPWVQIPLPPHPADQVRSCECPGQHLFLGAFRPCQPTTAAARDCPSATLVLGCGWGASENSGVRKGCRNGSAGPPLVACFGQVFPYSG
jgi:hypothetical protein